MSTKSTTAQPGGENAAPALNTKQLTGIIGALALAAFLMILNETVLTVALPSIMADLQVSAAAGQWLTTGFLLTVSVVIPTTGFLLQRFTTRSLFIFALASFLAGTVLAVFASSFAVLLIARIIQAVGTAIVLPLLMTTTLTLVPPHKRGAIMGLNSIVISVGPALGPTVSGAIVNALSWHWIFVLMLPIAAVVLALGIIFIKIPSNTRKLPVDVPSVILSALAFGFLVYAISSLEHAADNLVLVGVSVVVGAGSLALFIQRQIRLTRTGRELLNLAPFRNRNFSLSVVLIMIAMGTLLGTVVIVPIMLQTGSGLDTLTIGLMLLPGGLIQAAVGPVFGRVFDRFGPRPVLIPGAAMLALGQWMYVGVTPESATLGLHRRPHRVQHRSGHADDGTALLCPGHCGTAALRPRVGDLQHRPAARRCDWHHHLRDRAVHALRCQAGRRFGTGRFVVLRCAHRVHHRRAAGHRRPGPGPVHQDSAPRLTPPAPSRWQIRLV